MATIKNKILALKESNPDMKSSAIAKRLGVKPAYVYTTIYLANKAKKTKVAALPKASAPKAATPIFVPTQPAQHERMEAEIDDLRKEVGELTTIIAYLERRCASWERIYGSPV